MSIPYRTKDLNEAAFIWCQEDCDLTEIEPEVREGSSNNKPEVFFFKFSLGFEQEALKKLQFDYANSKTRVEPQQYAMKQSNLRDRLYAVKRQVRSR